MTAASSTPRDRQDAVDFLRGAVMVLMALDHTRDFFAGFGNNLTDPGTTTPALFFTRWITHFCAPVFVLLAGAGASLSLSGGRSRASLSRFLVTRGLWMVVLELTFVRFAWFFDLSYRLSVLQVIWAIGWSMVALAALCRLPTVVVAVVGLAMVLTHNLADDVHGGWLWSVLHDPGPHEWAAGRTVFVVYPLVPWIGVMAVGYALGAILVRPPSERRRLLAWIGASLCAAFVLLRAINHYGDPAPWGPQRSSLYTILSFLNCQKYPPSLDYLLMTLGPALVLLALVDKPALQASRTMTPVRIFGRVPLFYYLAHLYLLHTVALAILLGRFGGRMFDPAFASKANPGFGLPGVYAVWIAAVVVLYPSCCWFADVKRRRRDVVWLSYL